MLFVSFICKVLILNFSTSKLNLSSAKRSQRIPFMHATYETANSITEYHPGRDCSIFFIIQNKTFQCTYGYTVHSPVVRPG